MALITTFQPCRLHIWTKPNVNTLLLTLLGRGRWGGGNVDSKRGGMQKKEVYIGRERNEEEKWRKRELRVMEGTKREITFMCLSCAYVKRHRCVPEVNS